MVEGRAKPVEKTLPERPVSLIALLIAGLLMPEPEMKSFRSGCASMAEVPTW